MNTLTRLMQIYNTLCLVHTRGEDSIIMADCLKALQQCLQAMQVEQQNINAQLEEE